MRCTHTTDVVTTGGSEVVGTLVKPDGKPAAGAIVKLDTSANSSDTSKARQLDSTTTDASGQFTFFRDHGGGTFSIYGNYNNNELVALVRNIKDTVTSDAFHKVPAGTDTMFPPGFISGKVIINEASMTGTICYVPGTSLMAITGDDGSFVMSGVPPGAYDVYFYNSNYSVGRDPGVIVKPGDTAKIGTFILDYDPTKPIPVPRLVTVAYDTTNGVATVSWSAVHVSDLVGYYVYRGLNGKSVGVFDTITGADTVFRDTLYHSFADSTIDTCQYQVAAFDSGQNPNNKSNPITLVTVPPSFVRTLFTFSVTGAVNDAVEIGDTVQAVAMFSNKNNSNKAITWSYAGSVLKLDSVNAKSGADTVRHAFASSGIAILNIEAVDDKGNHWLDNLFLTVRPHHVDAVSCDSTTAGVTIRWNITYQPDFASYRLYRTQSGGDTLLYTTSVRADTSHAVLFSKNGIFQYHVAVVDSQGRVSPPGKSVGARIKNTPPLFTNDTAAIPKTASVGKQYLVQLAITDINGDSLSLKQLGSLGLTVSGTTVSWTPTILDTGTKHVAILVNDGFGGLDTLSWNVKVVPVGVCAWGDSMPTARFFLSATILNGSLYAVGGAKYLNHGDGVIAKAISTVESYPLSGGGPWTEATPLKSPRFSLGLAGFGNQLFSFGGTIGGTTNFTTIDSVSATGAVWDTAGLLPVALTGSAVCAIGSKVYCIGGMNEEGTTSKAIYEFDVTTNQLVLKNYMRTGRAFHQAVAFGGKIYIIGGQSGPSSTGDYVVLNSIEVYNPVTTMSDPDTMDTLKTPRYFFGAAEANGKLYALGGCSSESSTAPLSSIEEYDPVINRWLLKTDLPTPRSNCAAVSWQGAVYVIGGSVPDAAIGSVKATSSVVIYYP
jgi:hypothetical protein